ncbi:MAG: CapA family protein, partial [Firmicutes bacterium]|nr:CapA family protein [Bacillota bacterium]
MKKLGALWLLALLCWQSAAFAETLTLSFIGDCSIGQAIQFDASDNAYTNVLDRNGMDWPFSLVYPILSADDFTFANLEVVFTERTKHQDKRYPLHALPVYAQTLAYSGIDAVNTANNHAYDFLRTGYLDSMQTLDELSMPHFGSFNIGTKEPQDRLLQT